MSEQAAIRGAGNLFSDSPRAQHSGSLGMNDDRAHLDAAGISGGRFCSLVERGIEILHLDNHKPANFLTHIRIVAVLYDPLAAL